MRRVHVEAVAVGECEVRGPAAHHLRDVLRLRAGDVVEAFDDAGNVGRAVLLSLAPVGVRLGIEAVTTGKVRGVKLTIAAAVPKGPRADWMIEKLGELGVDAFVPLATQRSVTLPEGAGKIERWKRLASESARQSGRAGVMAIEPLMSLTDWLDRRGETAAWYLSAQGDAALAEVARRSPPELTLLVGPEGGWTEAETARFSEAKIAPARLTRTVLRVETAAVAAAAVVESAV